jgi:two-component system sensor histidine kinase BaeS
VRFGVTFSLLLLTMGAILAAGVWAALVALGAISATWGLRAGALAILVLGVGCFVLLARAMRHRMAPIAALIEAAAQVERGIYSTRVPERGGRDVRALARTFNTMSERLDTIDTQRRSFLADVAHELRTPLTIIGGRVEAMLDGIDPRDDRHLRVILDHAASLDRLVSDITTVALAETGSLTLHLEQVDLGVLLNAVADDFSAAARDAGVTLRVRVEAPATHAEADPARMRQALANLVSNALRHAATGGLIEIVLERCPNPTILAVRDDGEGIAPELLPDVFKRFVRSPDSPGSGLGLPIVADIATAHGGGATIESTRGRGTTIKLELP